MDDIPLPDTLEYPDGFVTVTIARRAFKPEPTPTQMRLMAEEGKIPRVYVIPTPRGYIGAMRQSEWFEFLQDPELWISQNQKRRQAEETAIRNWRGGKGPHFRVSSEGAAA